MRAGEFKHAEEALQLAIDREPAKRVTRSILSGRVVPEERPAGSPLCQSR